ncbi:hypothetical protein SADUNF_Sadunf19G0006400 [Salix dunnii]|uniref:Uncharacterized protein n=1 Tax=Salix dunnii TaxID=1413687 RepID=A0A835MKK4_9ROSI|nr:hypothetical protein SADUNF_Sadunf19G0006400 [Salix dunnii]
MKFSKLNILIAYNSKKKEWPAKGVKFSNDIQLAMGAAGENAKAKLVHHSWDNGTLSFASYQFTAPK